MRFIKKTDSALKLYPSSKLVELKNYNNKKEIVVKHIETNTHVNFDVDYVVLCTGYIYQQPKFLSSLSSHLEYAGKNFKINSDYSLSWKESRTSKIFIQNGARESHGVADPNLSLLAYRSAKILNSILGFDFYDKLNGSSLIDWKFSEEK